MEDHNLRSKNVSDDDAWTFSCPECELPFMQSFDFHNEEYHNGQLA